jgi:hypothetical protein
LTVLVLLAFATTGLPAAQAASPGCDSRNNNTYDKLLECVTVAGAMRHLEAFQAIADAHGDTRAAGTSGYDASATYVADQLRADHAADLPMTFDTATVDLPFEIGLQRAAELVFAVDLLELLADRPRRLLRKDLQRLRQRQPRLDRAGERDHRVGQLVLVYISYLLLASVGWRPSHVYLGIAVLAVAVPLALMVPRRGPESTGTSGAAAPA